MTLFFTADLHIGHANILKYCPETRPFANVDEMNATIAKNWNAVVKGGDTVYLVGDVMFGAFDAGMEVLNALNGRIHLIVGNHDQSRIMRSPDDTNVNRNLFIWRFESVRHQAMIKVPDDTAPRGRQLIFLNHYAMRVWDQQGHGAWQLFGHSHGTLPIDRSILSMDVGLDAVGLFRPISYDEVKTVMKHHRTPQRVDHHNEETT